MRSRGGRGAAHVTLRRPSPSIKEPAQVSNQPRGRREERLCPVRPQAHLLCSRSHGDTCPSRRLCRAVPGRRPPGRACGPSRSIRCPSRVFSPNAPGMSGPAHDGVDTGRLLSQRPTAERRCRAVCRQCRSVSRPMPWRTARGGSRTPNPARAGSDGDRACRRAGPGAQSCPLLARSVSGTACGPPVGGWSGR